MRPTRRQLLLTTAGALLAATARAQSAASPAVPPEVAAALPGARLQGSATLRFLGLRVYDSKLWTGPAPLGIDYTTAPFALELQYARELKAERIAERSLAEMQRQGELPAATAQRWLQAMQQLFPDVAAGDRLTGLHLPGQGARFFFNGRLRGEVAEADFARRFFGIWLAPQTSEPALRAALLGAPS